MNPDVSIAADVQDSQTILRVLDRYLPRVCQLERLRKGHSNSHFLVRSDGGQYVLRKYAQPGEKGWTRRAHSQASIQYEHAVLDFAQARGIPCVPAVPNRDGQTITQEDGRFYALFPFRDAVTYVKDVEVGVASAKMLGSFHRVMSAFAPACQRPGRGFRPRLKEWFGECEAGLGRAAEIVEWAQSLRPVTDTQKYMADRARCLSEAVEILHREVPAATFEQRTPVVNHGDFYYANIGCSDGQIATIYDFDDCVLDHPLLDLSMLVFMFASHGSPKMDLAVADAVAAAYRSVNELSGREMSLLPLYPMGHMLHITLALFGIARVQPEADLRWLTEHHMELVIWLMNNRGELATHFGRL